MTQDDMRVYNATVTTCNSACEIIQQLLMKHEGLTANDAAEETIKRVTEHSEAKLKEKNT